MQAAFSKLTLENTSWLAVLLSLALEHVFSQSPNLCSLDLLPGGSSTSCPPTSNEYDSPDGVHTKGGRKRKCASQAIDIDSRTKIQNKFSDWLKTHPSARDNKSTSQDVFSRVSFEKAACLIQQT